MSRVNAPQRQPGLAKPTVRPQFALDEMVLPNKDPRGPASATRKPGSQGTIQCASSAMKHKHSTFRNLDRKRRLIAYASGLAAVHTPDPGKGSSS